MTRKDLILRYYPHIQVVKIKIIEDIVWIKRSDSLTYQEFIYEIFKEDNDYNGFKSYSNEEIDDIIGTESFSKIERFLLSKGYNLKIV